MSVNYKKNKHISWGLGVEHEFLLVRGEQDKSTPNYFYEADEIVHKINNVPSFVDIYDKLFKTTNSLRFVRVCPFGKKCEKKVSQLQDQRSHEIDLNKHSFLKVIYDNILVLLLPFILPVPYAASNLEESDAFYKEYVTSWEQEIIIPFFKLDKPSKNNKEFLENVKNKQAIKDLSFVNSYILASAGIDSIINLIKTNKDSIEKNAMTFRKKAEELFLKYISEIPKKWGDLSQSVFITQSYFVTFPFESFKQYFLPEMQTPKNYFVVGHINDSKKGMSITNQDVMKTILEMYKTHFIDIINEVLSDDTIIKSERMKVQSSFYASNKHDIINYDHPFIEVKNKKFKNMTIDNIIAQIKNLHNKTLNTYKTKDKTKDKNKDKSTTQSETFIYPYSAVDTPYSLRKDFIDDDPDLKREEFWLELRNDKDGVNYAGSYHVWITLPHDEKKYKMDMDYRRHISELHALLAHRLQWIEPLFISVMSGHPHALGAGLKYARSSGRSMLNHFSGFGTTNTSNMIHKDIAELPSKFKWDVVNQQIMPNGHYFNNLEDAKKSFTDPESIKPEKISRKDIEKDEVRLLVNIYGKWVPSRICIDIGRHNYKKLHTTTLSTEVDEGNLDYKLDEPKLLYKKMMKKTHKYELGDRNDIRTDHCKRSFLFPIEKDWKEVWIKTNDSPQEFRLYFISEKKEKKGEVIVREKLPVDEKKQKEKDAVGFEYRLHDNCPLEDISIFMKTIALVGASVYEDIEFYKKKNKSIAEYLEKNRAIDNKVWNKTLVDVSGLGCFSPVSEIYINELYGPSCFTYLKTNERHKDKSDAFSSLCRLNEDLFTKYGDHSIYNMLIDKNEKQPPKPINRNYMFWKKRFEEMKEDLDKNTKTRGLLDHVAKRLLNISEAKQDLFDKQLVNDFIKDWNYDIYYLRAYYLGQG